MIRNGKARGERQRKGHKNARRETFYLHSYFYGRCFYLHSYFYGRWLIVRG